MNETSPNRICRLASVESPNPFLTTLPVSTVRKLDDDVPQDRLAPVLACPDPLVNVPSHPDTQIWFRKSVPPYRCRPGPGVLVHRRGHSPK